MFFRHQIPIVYPGDLEEEDEVLEWIIQNQSSADEEDVVERVGKEKLDIMIENVDQVLVLFEDSTKLSKAVLALMETIDDDCDDVGVSFVSVKDKELAADYNIDEFPSLVLFDNGIVNAYQEDIEDPELVMTWVVDLVTKRTQS